MLILLEKSVGDLLLILRDVEVVDEVGGEGSVSGDLELGTVEREEEVEVSFEVVKERSKEERERGRGRRT